MIPNIRLSFHFNQQDKISQPKKQNRNNSLEEGHGPFVSEQNQYRNRKNFKLYRMHGKIPRQSMIQIMITENLNKILVPVASLKMLDRDFE